MRIAVFGANGPTGRLATEYALAAGHLVTAVTRHPLDFPLRHERLTVLPGDVFDAASVDRAVEGQDAVLSSLGLPFSRDPITVYSVGLTHIMDSMNRYGIGRLVCVSSSAVDPAAGPHGGAFFEKVLQPYVVGVLGKTLYDDMKRMEALVRDSDLDWTVIRPSGLFETPEPTDYQSAERYLKGKFTSRADLASAMVEQLTDTRYLRTSLAVATFAVQPSLFQLLWREGFSKRSRPTTADQSKADQSKAPA
jgi:putative NADH-flavin reductase